jgi:hypothetical protein
MKKTTRGFIRRGFFAEEGRCCQAGEWRVGLGGSTGWREIEPKE